MAAQIRVLICGDRRWRDRDAIRAFVHRLPADAIVIVGRAEGADTLAEDAANERSMIVLPYPALWEEHDREGNTAIRCWCPKDVDYCRAAGMRRNQQMIDEGQPTLVVYFHRSLSYSKGTKDCVERARRAGIPTFDGTTAF